MQVSKCCFIWICAEERKWQIFATGEKGGQLFLVSRTSEKKIIFEREMLGRKRNVGTKRFESFFFFFDFDFDLFEKDAHFFSVREI